MLHAGLDLSRKKVDVCLLGDEGEHLDQLAVAPDPGSLRTLARRIEEVHHEAVSAVIESMTGARIVHDTLEAEGWDVEIADAQKVKGLAPLACKTDKIDSTRAGDLEPARPGAGDLAARPQGPLRARAGPLSPAPGQAQECSEEPDPLDPDQLRAPLPGHRPVRRRGPGASDKARRPRALARQRHGRALTDRRPRAPDRRRSTGACARATPTTPTSRSSCAAPGIGWVLAFTIAAEIGEIERFASPAKLAGYTGLCPRVNQSGESGSPRAADQARPDLPALGADRGDHARPKAPGLLRALPTEQAPAGQAARGEGRPDRHRAAIGPRDLAHALSK